MTQRSRFARVISIAACAAVSVLVSSPAVASASADLVISQVYGGGSNSGAIYNADFVEIFNRGTAAVSLAGMSVQYASATGTGNFGANANQLTVLPAATLNPGEYFLVKEAGGTIGAALPTPDAIGVINLSASGGKVALVNSTVSLGCNGGSNPCPPALVALIVDLVGYDGTNYYEGAGPAPTLSSWTAAVRNGGGCTDTDNNAADFIAVTPAPRSSSSPVVSCTASTSPMASGSASPSSVSAGDATRLRVAVSPGTNPASTGIAVAADLSAIGGSALQAFADGGDGTFTWTATVAGGTAAGATSIPVFVSDAQGRSATASIALIVTAPVPRLAIHDIQGDAEYSPWASQLVQTQGVVTAVKSNGFFMQAPDDEADADPNTSEGIFVFTSNKPPAAASVGNRVQVRAFVQDFIPGSDPGSPPVTELSGAPAVTLLSAGNALPAPVTLTAADFDPHGPLSQLARCEGMRVHLDGPITVVAPTGGSISEANATSTSNGTFYGVLPGIARPFREAGIEAPAVAPAGVPQFDANPERVRVDTKGSVGSTVLDVATGALVSNLTGVLDFGFRSYTILTDAGSTPVVTNDDARAIPVRPAAAEGELTVASLNLERFYDTADDPATNDAILTAAAFDVRLRKASLAIRTVLQAPDILGVEELENLSTLQALAQQIDDDATAAGQAAPGYQAFLFEGNDIGGIDVGLLVKASRFDALDVTQRNKDETFVLPDGTTALLNDRPPLVLAAVVKADGKELPMALTVVVNHLRSLTGIDGTDGARIRLKRLRQAESLAALIQERQQDLVYGSVVSVGDYNAYDVNDGFVDVINTVRGGPPHPAEDVLGEPAQLVSPPLVDLAPRDPAQRYSYVFDGNAQALDHVIASQSLMVNEFTYARSGADFPEVLRGDPTRPERISDHDAPVAYLAVPRDTAPPVVTVVGPGEGALYLLGTVPATSCTTTDALSGVAVPATLRIAGGDANGVGSITATCTGAVDNVGNVAADVSVHYRVVAYVFGGFSAPLGSGTATVKGGSTVPVKFQILDWNGALVTDTSVIAGIAVAPSAGCGDATSDAWTDATATGGTELRFDAGANQFVFNWKTSGLAPGCHAVAVRTIDTLAHAAPVSIR